jgi:predicted transcriptional regulator of viral defense system
MPGEAHHAIYELAADQLGYFTTAQARGVGVTPMAVVMMERRHVIERVSRGVYRLVQFPIGPLAQYMEASLWPVGAEGVISHESALALYGLSDVNPARVHVTVPSSFRIRRETPKHLVIHHADLPPEDWRHYEGIAVTVPTRTIRDCHAAALGDALVRQAVQDALKEGLLGKRDADQLMDALLARRESMT